jgi:hypothetical protein
MKIFEKIPGLLKDALGGLKDIVTDALSDIPVIGRFFGGGKLSATDKKKVFNDVLADSALDPKRKKIKALRSSGLSAEEILKALLEGGDLSEEQLKKLVKKHTFAKGGTVPGSSGPVPVIAHAGEWILNKMQQDKLTSRLGENAEQTKMWLFGTHKGQGKPGPNTTGTRPTSKEKTYSFRNFNLVPQQDPDGQVVWFIEMDDGAFGQVSKRDAGRIIKSNGTFIPGYVKRSTHGFSNPLIKFKKDPRGKRSIGGFALGGVVQAFAGGGVVKPSWAGHGVQSFAEGGTVLSQATGSEISAGGVKNIEQNFNVTTQGESDWNYILRIGAQHAQGSYT